MASFEGRYSRTFRLAEIGAFLVFLSMLGSLLLRMARLGSGHPVTLALGWFLGFLSMDFLSGAFHWAGDTWGSVTWPVIGPTVLRTFREHHVDQEAITRHDFIEVNATSCMLALPFLSYGLWTTGPFGMAYTAAIGVSAVLTNQIHAWAHRRENPWWIRALQRSRLILSPEAHQRHHVQPFTTHYCITTGWLNEPFARTGFWRGAEWLVSNLTGAEPRAEDRRAREAVATAHRMASGERTAPS
jgi:hypothetical protein